MTDDPLDAMKARWNHIQGYLFPWLREEVDPMTEALGQLVTTLDVIGLEAFVPEPPRGAGRPPDDRRALARAFVAKAVCRYKGTEVVAVTDAALQSICGDRLVMKALVSFLKTKQVYKGGHGHAGTTQVPIKVRIGGKVVDKPRFWIFDREALMQLRRAPSKPASALRSRGSVPPAKANRK